MLTFEANFKLLLHKLRAFAKQRHHQQNSSTRNTVSLLQVALISNLKRSIVRNVLNSYFLVAQASIK